MPKPGSLQARKPLERGDPFFNRCEPVIDQTGDESRELVSFSFVIALREFSATQSVTPVPPVK
jgi:hypothetical protein